MQQHDVEDLKKTVQAKLSLEEFKKFQTESRHIEKGYVDCSGRTGWSKGDYGDKSVTQTFARPYAKVPVAFSSVRNWKSKTHRDWVRLDVKVSAVTTTSITVTCHKWKESGDMMDWEANWITFPQ